MKKNLLALILVLALCLPTLVACDINSMFGYQPPQNNVEDKDEDRNDKNDEASDPGESETEKPTEEKIEQVTETETKTAVESQAPSEGLEFTSNGDGTCYVSGIGSCTDKDVHIPSVSPAGDTVTSIGDQAFYRSVGLKKITIPNGITSIGDTAFYGCSQLIQVEKGVSYVGKWVIDCETNIDNVVLRNNTVGIGDHAFDWFTTSITSIVIPNSVRSIGYKAFGYCESLKTVYYTGTMEEWAKIIIDSNDDSLKNATIIYNYVPEE